MELVSGACKYEFAFSVLHWIALALGAVRKNNVETDAVSNSGAITIASK